MNLKDRAIYRLPNGRELVACLTCDNETVLFSLSDSESGMYELNSEGRLLIGGQLTAWQIGDLLETGRIAASDQYWPKVLWQITTQRMSKASEKMIKRPDVMADG